MFRTQGAKVSQESFAPSKPCFAPVQLSFAPVQEDFGALRPKDFLHPLLTTSGTFEVSGPCSRQSGSQRQGYWTMEMIGGSSVSYLAPTPCVPLFCTLFNKGGNRRTFRLPGEGGDHFHCTVEPSPGHIRCRIWHRFNIDSTLTTSIS